MSTVHEMTDAFLRRIVARSKCFAERYSAVSAFLLESSATMSAPEFAAQATAYTLASWNLVSLSDRLEQIAGSGGAVRKGVSTITSHVALLGTLHSYAVRQARYASASAAEKVYASVTGDTLRAVLGELGEDLLAPLLICYVQTASYRTLPSFHILDETAGETVEHLLEVAQILHQLSEAEQLDQRYGVLADELVALAVADDSSRTDLPPELGALSASVRALPGSAFLTIIALLYTESAAGRAGGSIDPTSLVDDVLWLMKPLQTPNGKPECQ